MNTRELEKIAKAARVLLMTQCEARLNFVLSHEKDPIFAADGAAIRQLKAQKHDTLIEKAAYTWFNRFMAFRFMDVHGFNRPLVVSPAVETDTRPQLLSDALDGITPSDLPSDQKKRVMDLLLGRIPSPNAQAEVYRLLFLNACKSLRRTLPFLFEEVDEPIELLLPDDLLSEHSVPAMLRGVMDKETCKDVEIIGWLFQFYISDKKDAVMKKAGAVSSEDLPARTQLFTPEWIVRYLVENSLGRLWMENHPDSTLTQHMRYYLQPLHAEDNSLLTPNSSLLTVEELKLLDPACGSGHILVYAFELLAHIYEEEGYAKSQISELILRKNLYGLEIDPRAGQLAAFALVMKACLYDRSFFQRLRASQWNIDSSNTLAAGSWQQATDNEVVHIGILRNISFTSAEQQDYQKRLGKNLITQDLWLLMKQFENAETLGSLIIPRTSALRDIEKAINSAGLWDDLLLHETNKKLHELLKLAHMLSPRYQVVVANPPYLGNAFLSPEIKSYAEDHFPNSKSDLFAIFIERGLDLVVPDGYSAMVTMQSWMFLSSYEKMRHQLPQKAHIVCMAHMANMVMGIAFGTSATVFRKQVQPKYPGQYCYVNMSDLENNVPKVFPPVNDHLKTSTYENFTKIPGSPIAYWASDALLDAFSSSLLFEYSISDGQNKTSDNARFVRFFWEVDKRFVNNKTKWRSYAKGGGYRRWYGNIVDVVDWSPEAVEFYHKNYCARVIPDYLWYRTGITWGLISSAQPSFRLLPSEATFDVGGSSIFVKEDQNINYFLGLLNCKVFLEVIRMMNPTVNFQVRDIRSMPVIFRDKEKIGNIVENNILLSKTDWDSFETSWGFEQHPLIPHLKLGSECVFFDKNGELGSLTVTDYKISDLFMNLQQECEERFRTLKANEEELNRIFIDIYGLQDELTPEVDEKDVTVRRADLGRECRSLVSYAIGCIFGRYSLECAGLQYAGGPDDGRDVPAVLPLSEEQYSKDDATELVQQFLKDAYGEKYYAENLRFLEAGLGKDLRSYLCNDFYSDHIKIYQKRPIYWLFSSPKGSFKALIYLHRYTTGRVADVLALCREMEARCEISGQQTAASRQLSKADQRKAEKEAEKARAAFTEIKTWEKEVLAPLAEQRLAIDLDDGVKVNYAKFGDALAKIK